jgi:uncharacterized protein (DUF58 family)
MTTGQKVVLALLALSITAGFATGGKLYYRLSIFWALLFFGAWIWSAFSLRGLKFSRSARTLRAQVGQIFEEKFEVLNRNRIPRLWLEIHDESTLPGSDGSRVLTMLRGKQVRSYMARARLTRRGVFPLGPTVIASGDLFGLFPVERSYAEEDSLLVYPMMVDVRGFPNPPGLLPGGEALRRRTHQVTPNAAGVREYSTGDPLNRIHWLSTARRGRLIVKEFELDPLADVWIFLDAALKVQASLPVPEQSVFLKDIWTHSGKFPLPPSTEEYGVCIAASLVRDYLRRGRAVGFVCAGQHLTLISPDRGGRQLGKILEALALTRAEGSLPLRALIETQVKHMVRGSTVVLITPSSSRDVALVVDYLLQRGLKPIVVIIDSSTFGGAEGADQLVGNIKLLGVPYRLIKNEMELSSALSDGYSRADNRLSF